MIETASHDALEELHVILGVPREPDDVSAPLEPTPGLAALGRLVERARSTGLPVSFEIEGERPARVSGAVQLASFRIRQESLTNTRRHAPGRETRIRLAFFADRLRLQVENDLYHPNDGSDGSGGVGILGMRERATALGGSVQANRLNKRFRVTAQLPYQRLS
jgi:signal transduction histidine kinase